MCFQVITRNLLSNSIKKTQTKQTNKKKNPGFSLCWGNGLGLKLLAAKHEDLNLDPRIHERCGVWEASITGDTREEV